MQVSTLQAYYYYYYWKNCCLYTDSSYVKFVSYNLKEFRTVATFVIVDLKRYFMHDIQVCL
jgi:hypothetical protein